MIAPNTRILWLPGADERNWDYESGGWAGSSRNPAGVRIDPETALRSTVVLACVRVLSSSVAGLPLHLYRRLPNGGKELARENPLYRVLHDRPNGWQTSYEWREQMMLHLLTHGQAFVEISGAGPQTQLIVLHPSRMKVERIESGRLRYTYREASGSSTVYAQDAIMHLRWMSDDSVNGMVPVELAKDAIGLARACEIHGASFFANGARPGIVLSTDQMLSPEAAENTRNQWERAHRGPDRAQRTAVLQGGLKISEFGGNNQEAQFLEARRFQVEEICRIYGVPPHLVGDLSRSSYSNIEQQSLDYLQNGLMPWLRRIESSISRDLITDENLFAEFDTRGALRADAAGRAAYYSQMAQLGVLSVNDIRAAENMNPVEGGDERFVQLNMTTLTKAAAQPEPVPGVAPETAPAAPPMRSLPESRAMTISIDFDRTFAADPSLWGEFARQAKADGNTVVMVSRREDTPEDRQTVTDTLGDYAEAFSQVLLVGGDTLKEDGARAVGIDVDVWVDDSPQTIKPPMDCGCDEARDCGTGAGGFQPGNSCGKGGGGGGSSGGGGKSGTPSGGGSGSTPAGISGGASGGGDAKTPSKQPPKTRRKERLRDRIEGTQAEADLEVKKSNRKVRDIQKKIDALKSEIGGSKVTAAKAKLEAAEKAFKASSDKVAALKQQHAASKKRIAELKAKLDASKAKRAADDEIEKELKDLLDEVTSLMDQITSANKELDDIEASLGSL